MPDQSITEQRWARQRELYERFLPELNRGLGVEAPLGVSLSHHALATAMADVILKVESILTTMAVATERDLLKHGGYWSKWTRDRAMDAAVRWGIFQVTVWKGKPAWKRSKANAEGN